MSVNRTHRKISELSLLVGAIQHYDQEWTRLEFPGHSPFHDEKRDDLINELKELEHRSNQIAEGTIPLRVAVVGPYSTGKSSFLNALIGYPLIPTDDIPSSAVISQLHYRESENGKEEFIVAQLKDDGQRELTRSEYENLNHHEKRKRSKHKTSLPQLKDIEIVRIGLTVNELRHLELIDTPGFEAAGEEGGDDRVTMEYLIHADVLLWLFDAQNGAVRDSELQRLKAARVRCGDIRIFAIVNKLDEKPPRNRKRILDTFQRSLSPFDVMVLGFSALKVIELRKARFERDRKLERLWWRFRDSCFQNKEQEAFLHRKADVVYLQLGEKREEITLDANPDSQFEEYDRLLRNVLKSIRSEAYETQISSLNKRLHAIGRNVRYKKRRLQSSLERHIEDIDQSLASLILRAERVKEYIPSIVDDMRLAHQHVITEISHKFYRVAIETESTLITSKHFAVLRHNVDFLSLIADSKDRSPDPAL